jgi:pimeloyl-ACP methyl ester carboxylesterase
VFIFDGVYDNNTPAALVGDYFNKLQASKKELHWFENSGHNPMSDEPEKFKRLLREKFTEIANTEKVKGLKI